MARGQAAIKKGRIVLLDDQVSPDDPSGRSEGSASDERSSSPPRLDLIRDALIRLESVADVGHILLEGTPTDGSYTEALALACEKTRATIGLLFTCCPSSNHLKLAASTGLHGMPGGPPPALPLGQGLSGWVAQNRSPYISNNIHADGRFDSTSFLHYERLSAISVPILYRETLMGVLTLCSDRAGAFGRADLLTCEAMASSIALGLRCNQLRDDSRNYYLAGIQGLVNALEAKDPGTQGHSLRIAHFCREIGSTLEFRHDRIERLDTSARLHDIGKIGIPDRILHKPGRLAEEEMALVRQHPAIGAEILRGLPSLADVARIVEAHHERMDGAGYPQGLRGDEIPSESRIITVADAFDAMVMPRPYRAALSADRALKELRDCSGSQFDPLVVQALEQVLERKNHDHFYGGLVGRERRINPSPLKKPMV